MSEVFIWPEEVAVPFTGTTNLLKVATEAGIAMAHLCGGRAACSTCRVRVVDGLDNLSERTPAETAMATRLDFPDEIRLACQTEITDSLRLWRLVLDDVDVEMASQLGQGHYAGPVGREVEATVMFIDIAGFTTMSENLPAYDIVHVLNRFFNRAGDAIEAYGGHVDNYMGDGMLAVFGVRGEPDHALDAVKAGLDTLEAAASMSTYLHRIYGHEFNVRIGIGLGDVIFGLMGAESSARETVIGDVVNTASRLESANKTTGTRLLVTEDVHARTTDSVEYGRQFDLDLPGKGGHVVAFEVLGLAQDPRPSPDQP
jgi:class 3 adenylate cyclase